MALTGGTGPFAKRPAGRLDVPPPERPLLFWEPFPKRFRVVAGGQVIADTRRALALHETGEMMRLCVPRADVAEAELTPGEGARDTPRLGALKPLALADGKTVAQAIDAPPAAAEALAGFVVFDLEAADAWYLEDEPGYAHPRDPYHRFDVHPSSDRVTVRLKGEVIARSAHPAMLFETGLPPRYYFAPTDVRRDLLERSGTISQCPYKGDGQHWHVVLDGARVQDAAWSLTTPMGDALTIPRWFSFYDDKVDIEVERASAQVGDAEPWPGVSRVARR